jgi:hypothetical protein
MYKGKLLGDPPVLKIVKRIDVGHLMNCEVAVKMLPAHAGTEAVEDFHSEMDFMKVWL